MESTLFPLPTPTRAGIARLAAASPAVRERSDVRYFALACRSALNRQSSGRMPFALTLNPYRGCEFGCHYCYARYTHEFMEIWDGRDFERKIFAKVNAPELLRSELRRAKDKALPIAVGTATDPYQPAERQFEVMRRLLGVLAEFEGLSVSITTKSVLILRDLELLRAIAQRHDFRVHVTVTTTHARLARRLEPKAPPPAKRLEVVAKLSRSGIRVSVNAMPILPGITDDPGDLEKLVRAAAEAGADSIEDRLLFLKPSAMKCFLPFLEEEFPQLVARYRRLYAGSPYLFGEYPRRVKRLMDVLRARYGLSEKGRGPARVFPSRQLSLGLKV